MAGQTTGLLQKAALRKAAPPQSPEPPKEEALPGKSGLLKRAQRFIVQNTPAFDEWAARRGFAHAGILEMLVPQGGAEDAGGYYHMTEAVGFSARTLASSLSARRFWDGSLSRATEWQCFSRDFNELAPFLDRFGGDLRGSLASLYFLPFKDRERPMIFVAAELDGEDDVSLPPADECAAELGNVVDCRRNEESAFAEMADGIDEGLKISSAHLLIISLKSCVERIVQSTEIWRELSKIDMADRIEMKAHILRAVADAARSLIAPLFRRPNCLHVGTNGDLKIVMFGQDEPDEELLAFHLASSLAPLLGPDAARQMLLLSAGVCPNKKGALAFLQKG